MPTKTKAEQILEAMEQAGTAVSAMTGIKKRFIDQGWSEAGAEAMTIQLLAASNTGQAKATRS
jgi:hypothetical protein